MTAMFRRYTDFRSWLRNLARSSLHAGTTAVLATLGTNTAENYFPEALARMGMDWRQTLAAFFSAALITAIQKINKDTADTHPPFDK